MDFIAQIPDPMWGSIPTTQIEDRVLQHGGLSRLAQIKQMGLAFLDFPSLSHTRLEHSIGVMHVADRLYTILSDSGHGVPRLSAARRDRVRQAVRLAALFHDLGHPPFSHAVEHTFKKYPQLLHRAGQAVPEAFSERSDADIERIQKLFSSYSHEEYTRWLVGDMLRADTPLARFLRRELDSLVDEIPGLAIGKAQSDLSPYNPVISGDFDADRIDYLIRDNRHSGFAIGLGLEELHNAVHFHKSRRDRDEIYIDASALPFVNSVLSARQRLIRRVHLAPSGRVATQMLVNCLYCVLDRYEDSAALARTIYWLHSECTDYTFYKTLLREISTEDHAKHGQRIRRTEPSSALFHYFIKRFESVARHPSALFVWPQHISLHFMQMHPCLRLLAHIAATNDWKSPDALTVHRGNELLFIEPSARPSQGSDLLVDYDRKPSNSTPALAAHRATRANRRSNPSLDFVASTENRLGRAILVEAMSNLDIYTYVLNDAPDNRAGTGRIAGSTRRFGETEERGRRDYWSNLRRDHRKLAKSLTAIASDIRSNWAFESKGMIATEYLLVALYALDRHVRDKWRGARGVYVYRSEYFVNKFIPSLGSKESATSPEALACFPSLFKPDFDPVGPGKKVFSQIQRLAAFGLIITRMNNEINAGPRQRGSGATRTAVHSTREEIRINAWGRHYVEREIEKERVRVLREEVLRRQRSQDARLQVMAQIYGILEAPGRRTRGRALAVAEGDRERHDQALAIHKGGGCAMTFACPTDQDL
jgi:HD superfamily phosphohydrolase